MDHPFTILKLYRFSTEAQVRKQYKKLALKYHPDKAKADDIKRATRKFQRLQDAYETIMTMELYAPDIRPGRLPNFMKKHTSSPSPENYGETQSANGYTQAQPDDEDNVEPHAEPEPAQRDYEAPLPPPSFHKAELRKIVKVHNLLIVAWTRVQHKLDSTRKMYDKSLAADADRNLIRLLRILEHIYETRSPCSMPLTSIVGFALYFSQKLKNLASHGGRGTKGRYFCTPTALAAGIAPPLLRRQEMDQVIRAFDQVREADRKCCLSNWQHGSYGVDKDLVPGDIETELRLWRKWVCGEGIRLARKSRI